VQQPTNRTEEKMTKKKKKTQRRSRQSERTWTSKALAQIAQRRLPILKASNEATPNGKQDGELTGSLAIVKADKMSASLTDEQLAAKVRDGFAALRPQLEEWLPLAIELRSRFETLKKERVRKTILGCRSWEQFCEKRLGYTDRHVRRLMEGSNPAAKYQSKTKRHSGRKRFAASSDAASAQEEADWSDRDFITKSVRDVTSNLRPLESDPPRHERVARAIAKEIVDAFMDDDDDADSGNPGAEK
jgi:hypothetical protein